MAKTSDAEHRARAFSIFYAIVNIGAFTGKTFAYPLRIYLGLESINFFSASMTFIALVVVYFFYRNVDIHGEGKTIKAAWHGLVRIVSNVRLLTLILIVTGFWIIQQQMYATMPKYVLRTVGNTASPEWIAVDFADRSLSFILWIVQCSPHHRYDDSRYSIARTG